MGIIRNGINLHPMVVFIGHDFSIFSSHGNSQDHGISKHLMGTIGTMVSVFPKNSQAGITVQKYVGIIVIVVFHLLSTSWVLLIRNMVLCWSTVRVLFRPWFSKKQ